MKFSESVEVLTDNGRRKCAIALYQGMNLPSRRGLRIVGAVMSTSALSAPRRTLKAKGFPFVQQALTRTLRQVIGCKVG